MNNFLRSVIIIPVLAACLYLFLTVPVQQAQGQTASDTSKNLPIQILPGNTTGVFVQTASGGINKLIGNVTLKQGETMMYCDSAYFNLTLNNVEAFSNVRIIQPGGTQVQSDYLRYTGNTRQAYLLGNVSLADGENNLWAEELEYNLGTKIGRYTKGGTLQSAATTLSSNSGMYNVRTKDSRFTGEVFVTDPEYNVVSEDLAYNTGSKVVRFHAPSVVTNDRSELRTSEGTWDAKNEIGIFTSRSSIQNVEQYIEADHLDYNRVTGFGYAKGNVIAIDTTAHRTLYCGYASYNENTRQLLSAIKPVMKQVNGRDSLFTRADTFFSAPVPRATDTIKKEVKTIKGKNIKETVSVTSADSIASDSTRPRYFIGYHNVKVFSDSLQARCDSMSYSQEDSVMRLMYHPVAWARSSQITGDTILLYADSSSIRKLFVPNNALIISRSGPPKADMFDQVQGKTLTGYFENNAIDHAVVWPNAESIFFATDKEGAYLGVTQASSERMRVLFAQKKIRRIVLEQDTKQSMTPMRQVNIPTMRLSRYQWLESDRPRSKEELFE